MNFSSRQNNTKFAGEIKPQLERLLLDLARVWLQLNDAEQAHAALLAASRGADARTAEHALEEAGTALSLCCMNLKMR